MAGPDFDPAVFGLDEPDVVLSLVGEHRTRELGAALARALGSGGFLGLVGDLGAGKTTLMQGLAGARGARVTSSPTYTLVNVYEEADVVHMDLYRLESQEDLESIGYWDYVEDEGVVIAVEWVDQVPQAWPGSGIIVQLVHEKDARTARVWVVGLKGDSVTRALEAL